MEAESEVNQKLHYQVDNWDEHQELLKGPQRQSQKMDPILHQHAQLCSPYINCTSISAYSVTIHWEHGITDFLVSLSVVYSRLLHGILLTLPERGEYESASGGERERSE
jgi:hypothetical protein